METNTLSRERAHTRTGGNTVRPRRDTRADSLGGFSHCDPTMPAAEALLRERERTFAWLHDTTLQALEFLAAGGYADDPDSAAMTRVAAEAADALRAMIEGELPPGPGSLVEELHEVVEMERNLATHDIVLEIGRVDCAPVVAGTIQLAAATAEALRNARKHAQARRVLVSCEIVDGMASVVITDDGVGFDPAAVVRGAGLRYSIVRRVENEGGVVAIEATPGRGSRITMRMRLAKARGQRP